MTIDLIMVNIISLNKQIESLEDMLTRGYYLDGTEFHPGTIEATSALILQGKKRLLELEQKLKE